MKTKFCTVVFAALFSITSLIAQQTQRPARFPARPLIAGAPSVTNATNSYASDIAVVHDAQAQALEQAKEMLAQGENVRDRSALETAIKQMELAQTALDEAKKSPEKLPAALAAEQSAYQALLKVTPREYRMQRQRGNQGGQAGQAGQASQRQMNQLDMQREENRYETERQASAPQNAQQREQLQTADRLKELAQRQQDLNERLRELQTALQAARTEQERADIQRQLKRLRDEQREMLASVDELRQRLEQSPNASSQAEAREQLEQARSEMQRAAQEMERQSASQALAAGTRAQQTMQNLRDDLRRQTGSQFAEQMRQMRNEARELTKQQEEIASKLDALNNGARQSLDNSAERQQLVEQMARQQGALTNLLGGMRNVTEQAEATEPLLSRQLYDTLRRADQMRTENLLELGSQLTRQGFLPQASQAERVARTNITELARSVERAAESVLGSEADALRFAQRELDDLTRQVERELAGGGTNAAAFARGGTGGAEGQSNQVSRAAGNASGRNASRNQNTNEVAGANGRGAGSESQAVGNNGQRGQRGQGGQQPGGGENGEQASAEGQQGGQDGQGAAGNNGQRGQRGQRGQGGQQPGSGENGEQASAENQQEGQGGQGGQGLAAGNNPGNGNRDGALDRLRDERNRENNSTGQRGGAGQRQGGQNGGNVNDGGSEGGYAGGGGGLREFVQQLGRGDRNRDVGGPITGGGYVNWADRLRDVETTLDSQDLRTQLATVRERASVIRGEYRDNGRKPDGEVDAKDILAPLSQVRVWLAEELARKENVNSLVPLDRDPVPENYSELVRAYYEKLGSAQ